MKRGAGKVAGAFGRLAKIPSIDPDTPARLIDGPPQTPWKIPPAAAAIVRRNRAARSAVKTLVLGSVNSVRIGAISLLSLLFGRRSR
jgi:hypothetical protein